MFERFTRDARTVVVAAREESRALDHGWIGTGALLLGLTRAEATGALLAQLGVTGERLRAELAPPAPDEALATLGIDLEEVRRRAEASFGAGALGRARRRGRRWNPGPPITPEAKKALELSLREALALGDNHIGAEHILLGVVRGCDHEAVAALARIGVGCAEVRAAVLAARVDRAA